MSYVPNSGVFRDDAIKTMTSSFGVEGAPCSFSDRDVGCRARCLNSMNMSPETYFAALYSPMRPHLLLNGALHTQHPRSHLPFSKLCSALFIAQLHPSHAAIPPSRYSLVVQRLPIFRRPLGCSAPSWQLDDLLATQHPSHLMSYGLQAFPLDNSTHFWPLGTLLAV